MKPKNVAILILLSIGMLFVMIACATQQPGKDYVKDGKAYGKVKGAFRGRWWNYYERGLSFSDGEFFREAAADFNAAVRQREKDQRMARTYGMHFIDYFPHRELGIVFYEMRDLKAAQEELEQSLSHFPSAKARFYLDRVRKALLEQEAKEVTAPKIVFDHKTDEIWTREDPVVLSGVAEDNHYITGISISGAPLFLEGSNRRIPFKKALHLPQGRHVVTVEAKNLLGKVATRQVVFHVDREGPMISLARIEQPASEPSLPEKAFTISGSVYDEGQVHELMINGRPIPIQKGVEVFFSQRIVAGKGDLELTARDRLGNQTSAVIPFPPVLSRRQPPILASAGGDGRLLFVAGLFGPKDTRRPSISLKGWTQKQTVFLDKVYIEGRVSDENKIVRLTVNQHPILRREGQTIFFSHLADLKKGQNSIAIEARDEAGNTATQKISITRQVPKALQLAERLSLTVLPFELKGIVSDAGLSFQDNLINSLVNQNRFRVVERTKLDLILQEQKLSRTQLVDRSTALKLGKLVAAGSVITGSMIETRKGIEIVARMIDTETAEIVETEDVYDESKDLMALRNLAEGMAIKFHLDFPLLDGLIVQQKGKFIFTDLGKEKIKVQRRLIVYREEPIKHPVTGKVLGADNVIIGRARVTQVMPDLSKAEISTDGKIPVKPMDKVITE